MTVEAIELPAERSARAHLQACHPSLTVTYSTCVPYLAILLDLREVGFCTCASPSPKADRSRWAAAGLPPRS